MKDAVIIGAGIAGTSVARELARYELDVVLVDKENDVSNATTMANSAIVHAGYDAKPGTNKSKFNVDGNPMFDAICDDLDVPFKRIGSMVLAFAKEEEKTLETLLKQGQDAGIPNMRIITGEEVRTLEPNVSEEVTAALLAETAGIVSPYELAIALAENAVDNGVALSLNTEVTGIDKREDGYIVKTNNGDIRTKYVINAAGVYADKISAMVGDESYHIQPRKGHYFVMDKSVGAMFNHVLFQCPSEKGKGILVTPTVHGNALIGPDSEYVSGKDDLATDAEHLSIVRQTGLKTSEVIPFDKVIRSFVGLRATADIHDFVIGESGVAPNFLNVGGFESPGLSSAPAVAVEIARIIADKESGLKTKATFNPKRRPVVRFMELSDEEKAKIIKEEPRYGNMICRCEMITEAEIVDCIHRNVGATTLKGVKKEPGREWADARVVSADLELWKFFQKNWVLR